MRKLVDENISHLYLVYWSWKSLLHLFFDILKATRAKQLRSKHFSMAKKTNVKSLRVWFWADPPPNLSEDEGRGSPRSKAPHHVPSAMDATAPEPSDERSFDKH